MKACLEVPGLLTDNCLYPVTQIALVAFAIAVAIIDRKVRSIPKGGFEAKVTRGEKSMAKFYAIYGVFTTVFITITVSVDFAESHRTFFVFLDILVIAYICLWNGWFRNKLIGWSGKLSKREH